MPKPTLSTILLGIGLAVAALTSCAFFNTFYNAKVAFDSAYREHKKQMRQFPDSLIAPTGTALTNYDRAIEKSGKVLQVYPKSKRWLDDATFLMGKAYFYKGELAKAIRRFLDLQDEYPGSPHIPESYLLLGHAYLLNGDLSKAEETLTMVLDKYPQLNANEDVSMLLAQIAIRREGRVMAIELLEKIRKSVHSDEKKIDLILQTSQIYFDLHQYGRAAALLGEAPRRPKLVNQMYRIDYLLLDCYIAMDSLRRASALAEIMLRQRDYDAHTPSILLRKADIFDLEKNYDEALSFYDRVAKSADTTSGLAGQAWFSMAVIYQMDKGDLARAKDFYLKAAAKLKDKDRADLAARRARAIGQLDTLARAVPAGAPKGAVAADQTPPTPRQFKMGELFWLELDQPDSAFRHYGSVVADTSLDSEMRSKALYAQGYLALNAFKDTARADSIFGRLVAAYPANKYSRRSQIDRNRPVTIETHEDSAWDAFATAEKTFFEQDSAIAGARAYLDVHKNFPGTEAAAKSLFTAAWICDNVLYKKKTAKTLYERVCAESPNSDYCVNQAKPRLKIALDTLAARKERNRREPDGAAKDLRPKPGATEPAKGSAGQPTKSALLPSQPSAIADTGARAARPDSAAHQIEQLDIPE